MISFLPLNDGDEREIVGKLVGIIPDADGEEILEIIDSFSGSDDCEVAFSASHGCLLVRIFDSEYLFVYPIALSEGADALAALNELRLYAIKEEIPLTVIDLPSEELSLALSLFKHASTAVEDSERGSYTLFAESEIALLEEIPEVSEGKVSLSPLTKEDERIFATLSRDEKTNKYWGYDFSLDNPDAPDEYFLNTAREEFSRGVALSLAVRAEGKFAGEALIYYPDLQGGAECAIRLLPDFRGKGVGKSALQLLFVLGAEIGFDRLYAAVYNANEPSLCLFSRLMEKIEQNEKITRFCKNL
jgi:RimJ/RimL family protein N-acetyltransferase